MLLLISLTIGVMIIIYLIKDACFSPFTNFPRPKNFPILGVVAKYWNTDHIDTMVEVAKDFKEEGLYYEKSLLLCKFNL